MLLHILLGVIVVVTRACGAEMPSFMHICGLRNPHLDECLNNSISTAWDSLVGGFPKFSIASMDPLRIKHLNLFNSYNIKLTGRDIKIFGMRDINIDKVHLNLDAQRININITLKLITVNATYDMDAKLFVPIATSGSLYLTSSSTGLRVMIKFGVVLRNGRNMLVQEIIRVRFIPKDTHLYFFGAGGNKQFMEVLTQVANDPEVGVVATLLPTVERILMLKMSEIFTKICSRYSYEELLPDRE